MLRYTQDSSATSFRMEPLLEGLLRSLGGSEANFLELCFGRFRCGKFHTRATSKKFRPPSGNFRPNPPELPRRPSRSFSSRGTGWRTLLTLRQGKRAQRLTFWVRRPRGGVGVFHVKGWGSKSSCSPSKVRLPWVSKRGIWDVPDPWGCSKSLCKKKVVRIFRSLYVLYVIFCVLSMAQTSVRMNFRKDSAQFSPTCFLDLMLGRMALPNYNRR